MKKKISRITFVGLTFGLLILTSCHIWCSLCSSRIENVSSKDIYVILTCDPKAGMKLVEHISEGSVLTWYQIDTVKNTGMFRLPPNGYLRTYDGPGDNPARLLSSLKILTEKRIFDFKTQEEIVDAFDKREAIYRITIGD